MGFASETGYVPVDIETIITSMMEGVNTQFGTTYTYETFVGTNFYKYMYAIAQRVQQNEIKTSEIFLKLQDYFNFTNETILSPKVTPTGFIEAMQEEGYTVSVKPMIEADAGKCHICVDVDSGDPDYATTKLAICNLIKDYMVAGVVTFGTEDEDLTLTNGQLFNFAFNLPDITDVHLRLTVTLSRNNQGPIDTPDDQKQKLLDNIAARYSLGKDFEPERYFTIVDAPWASDILLEYSLDAGANWEDETYIADYDELFTVSIGNVTLIEV
jgi:hypothetical protein